ncbi:hypothetical protein [Streptomyces roseolus]|uniref:hypothetical protein n=1 Tax=Streptomyces roseolus TaxID=67358 RepID=UPI001677A550|nr:hypothetical protein [Streptomyces roseolus]
MPQDTAPRDATLADVPPARAVPGGAAPGDARPADAVPLRPGPAGAGRTGASPGGAPAEDATPTGSFRLAAPAPWEAPAGTAGQNGGRSAQAAGSDGPAAPTPHGGPLAPAGQNGGPLAPAGRDGGAAAPVGQNGGSAVGAGHGGSFEAAAGPGFGPASDASGGSGGFGPPSGGFGTGPGPAAPHGQAPATAPGWAGAGTLPPPPPAPPGGPGGPGGSGGQGEARPLQAVAVGLLNLSCLGLGYVLLRHWIGAAVCWAATAALLLLALPADANGVPAGALVGYGAVLLAAAADGARRGLRARLSLGATARRLALPLAVVLLAAPAGATVAYGAAREEAREEAFQQSLLARLAAADALVKAKEGVGFDHAERDYRTALDTYERLALDHPGSRAAKLVPERMDAYFASVSAPYTEKKYCEAVDPLTHLRSLPDSVDEGVLGNRADGLDDSLARSLYECGAAEFGRGALQSSYASFTGLASLFPKSEHIGKVERLVGDGLRKAAAPLGDGNAPDPCATTEQVRKQRDDAAGLKGYALGGPVADAGRAVQKGAFSCGAKQFRDGLYSEAVTSMDRYAKDYPNSPQAAHARTISIAAQIADHEPAAGKKLPPATAPGGSRMPMVVSNDGKESVELLYTGPVTGKITLEACGTCENYGTLRDAIDPDAKPCGGPSSKYPKATLRLPAGTYHFLQRRAGGGFAVAGETKTSKASVEPGYTYTNCLYVTTVR